MARRIDDPESLALALVRRQFTGGIGPEETQRRLRESSEMHELGEAAAATSSSRCARTSTGSATGSSSATSAASTPTSPPTSGWPPSCASRSFLWHIPLLRGMRALIDGRFDDAETLAAEALAGGERAQEPVSAMFYAIQDSQLRRLRRGPRTCGGSRSRCRLLGELAERYPAIPAWRCSLAAAHAELGHAGEARAVFEPLAANDFDDLPLDAQWVISLALLAETAAFLGDVPRVAAPLRAAAPVRRARRSSPGAPPSATGPVGAGARRRWPRPTGDPTRPSGTSRARWR